MNMGSFIKLEDGSIMFQLPYESYKNMTKEEAFEHVEGFRKMMNMIDSKTLVNQTYPFEGVKNNL